MNALFQKVKKTTTPSFNAFILPCLKGIMASIWGRDPITRHIVEIDKYDDHILGFLHKSYQGSYESKGSSMPKFHSVIELHRAGVSFEPNNEDATSLTGIKLEYRISWYQWPWSKPTLRMPVLRIDDATEMVLRNLIAYEQSSYLVENYICLCHAYAN